MLSILRRDLSHKSSCKSGFTLLELSIVLLILSLIAGGLLTALTQNTRIRKDKELQTKLIAIEEGLVKFRRQYNRLPCPADGTLTLDNSHFGQEASNTGTCDGNPGANFNDGIHTKGGVVPVRTIGLPDDYMFDPWGGRISYAVDGRMTSPSAFVTYPVNDPAIGSITILDGNNNTITTHAVAAIVSHGVNGHGAFQLSGSRKSTNSNNVNELLNCHCDINGVAATYTNTFIIQPPTGNLNSSASGFDDVLRYWVRSQIFSANDIGMR